MQRVPPLSDEDGGLLLGQVGGVHRRHAWCRQPTWHRPDDLDAARLEIQRGRGDETSEEEHEPPRRPPGQPRAAEEDEERVRATYGANWDRLVEVKETYDPDNFFHLNQNFAPAA